MAVNELPAKLEPSMTIAELQQNWDQYQELIKSLEKPGDFVVIQTSKGPKRLPTKTWRVKLERYFGLSCAILESWTTQEEDKTQTYHKRSRVGKTGVVDGHEVWFIYHEATGACNTGEKSRDGSKAYHNAESHAETRAKNRAMFEFVGMGELSAEEMTGESKPASEKTETNKNFKFLSEVGKLKMKLHEIFGTDEVYYNVCGSFQVNHSNEIKNRSAMVEFFKVIRTISIEAEKEKRQIKEFPGISSGDMAVFVNVWVKKTLVA